MCRTITIVVLLILALPPSFSQENLSYAEQLKAIEDEMDSLSIFNLIDSLFILQDGPASELNLRIAFTTNVTSGGRDYDLDQSGISSGISYYHKSGFYGDIAGYWNSGIEPNYNPTVLSFGYLGNIKRSKWGYSMDFERWFYNPNDTTDSPLTNSLGGSLSYDFKWGFAAVDYSYLFGEQTASRIIATLTGTINIGRFWIFDNISLFPSASIMAGNNDVTQLLVPNQINEQTANRIRQLTTFANLTERQQGFIFRLVQRSFNNGTIDLQTRNRLLSLLREAENLTEEEIAALNEVVDQDEELTKPVNEFGVLNYAFTLPLSLSTGRFNILLSYTYSIPLLLPGEASEDFVRIEPLGFFGASVSYRIPFK